MGDALLAADGPPQAPPERTQPRVRPVESGDVPAVGRLFQRVFRKSKQPPGPALLAYLNRLFVTAPGTRNGNGDAASLVHLGPDGEVNGFIGIIPMPFLVGGIKRQAAFAGTLMVDEDGSDPMAGARLLRGFRSGPYDILFSETANEVSQRMWRRLRGLVLPGYSLEWLRVFRPAAFGLALMALRRPVLNRLRFAASPIDRLLAPALRTAPMTPDRVYSDHPVDDGAVVSLIERFTEHYAVRPDWSAMNFAGMLADARSKSRYGEMTQHVVMRAGIPIGLFIYHAKPEAIGHVLQIAAAPGRMEEVVDCLFAHAAQRGLAALRGRTQPALLEALLPKRCQFLHRSATVALSPDKEIAGMLAGGEAFINGLAGEAWIRLIGDDLD